MSSPIILMPTDGTNTIALLGSTVTFAFGSPNSNATPVVAYAPISGLGYYHSMAILAQLEGAVGDVLNLWLQTSADGGTTWEDWLAFPQLADGAAQTIQALTISRAGQAAVTQVGTGILPTLAAGTILGGDWGDRIRPVAKPGANTILGSQQTIQLILIP